VRGRALVVGAALQVAACSYDLDVLRGRDGGVDAPRVDLPVAEMPTLDMTPPPDRVTADVPMADVRPARDASMGACMGQMPVNLGAGTAGLVTANGVTSIEGNTTGGAANIVGGCQEMATTSSTTRVYRYVVQTGPRLVATTNTGLCGMSPAGAHDTILAAYFTCGMGGLVPGPRSCVDDDDANLCEGMMACTASTNLGCGTKFSSLELSGLVPGDVVYLAVSSYMDAMTPRGPFRLSVAENGLSPAAPPTAGMYRAANRCACPSTTAPFPMWASRAIDFPRSTDQNQLMSASRSVFGNRPVMLTQVWGVSGSLRLSNFSVSTAGDCAVSGGAKAALDVILGTTVIASVSLGVYVGEASTVTIPFTSFAPIAFAMGASPSLQYQIRNVQPAESSCVSINIDVNAPNTLTLYGAM
jgi:hypothetical protein